MTEGIVGAHNSSVRMPEEVSDSVTPPVVEVGSFLLEGVSPMVAAGAPLARDVREVVMDSVPLLVVARGGVSGHGVVPMVDFAVMSFPAVVGVMSPAEFAGMALPAIAGVAPRPSLLKRRSWP